MSDLQARLDYAESVADWFLDQAEQHLAGRNWEGALKCAHLAATVLCRQNRILFSPRLESALQRVAEHLPGTNEMKAEGSPGDACLHVLTEALPAGGLTAMATRWMLNDRGGRRHSVALLGQRAAVPEALIEAVRQRGGRVELADPDASFGARALWLRQLARSEAGLVVLHVDVSDVICGAAFGVPGGPPVVLVNHTAHTFWTGASVIDLILNCRGSVLEGVWAETHRRVPRFAPVPIPLIEPACANTFDGSAAVDKRAAREELHVPQDAVVLLTVGAFFKYLPTEGMDFVVTCERLLSELPHAVVVAAGFQGDERWQQAARRVGGRIRTVGRVSQEELARWHAASDIYLEGFPFGTTTSLLEAALRGLPVVLAPASCPPPYGSDGVALDDVLSRPASVPDYERQVLELSRNPDRRVVEGQGIRQSVQAHHTGDGWRRHLSLAQGALPTQHAVYDPGVPVATAASIHEHWARFLPRWTWGYEQTLENALLYACRLGLRPRVTASLRNACLRARGLREGHSIPLPLLALVCNVGLRWLPRPMGENLVRVAAFACRGSLPARLWLRGLRALGLVERPRGAYQEYREARVSRT